MIAVAEPLEPHFLGSRNSGGLRTVVRIRQLPSTCGIMGCAESIRSGTPAPAGCDKEDQAMKESQRYPLRLPRSLKDAVKRLSREERTSINQFVATAVAEKVSALQTARFFTDRKARADFKAFDKIMRRRGGKPPREGDEMPK
jgi:hypothetical protein